MSARFNRVLLPNLFFEEELQSSVKPASTSARRVAAELGSVMGLLGLEQIAVDVALRDASHQRSVVLVSEESRPDDVPPALQGIEFLTIDELAGSVAHELPPDPANATGLEAVPWGWSDVAVHAFRKAGVGFDAPDRDVVRLINSRQFQEKFDTAVRIDGEERRNSFGTLCRSLSEVMTAISIADDYSQRGWVIKADLSHASRNRLRGKSREFSSEQHAWLSARFASGECVYVEPWVERIAECGLQFHVQKSSHAASVVEFVGASEMLTDETGRYRGSVVQAAPHGAAGQESDWQPAIDHGRQIVEAAAMLGYFGPLGIDCMVFRCPTDNRRWLRLAHDINGRLTMGRVALSLRRWLKPGESGYWMHVTTDSGPQNENRIDEDSCGGVRIIPTSPCRIGGRATKIRTGLFAASDPDRLNAIRMQILGCVIPAQAGIQTGGTGFPPARE